MTKRFRNHPQALFGSLLSVAKPVLSERSPVETRLLLEWPLIAGEALAAHTMPKRLRNTKMSNVKTGHNAGGVTLHLEVETGAALEVSYAIPELLDRIAAYFGARVVERIAMIQVTLPQTYTKAIYPAGMPKDEKATTDNAEDTLAEIKKILDARI